MHSEISRPRLIPSFFFVFYEERRRKRSSGRENMITGYNTYIEGFFSRNTRHGIKQTSTSVRKDNNSQYVADWIFLKNYSEIRKEVLLLQFIARLIILLTLQQLYKTLSKQYYWSPQERCSLIKRFHIVINWNLTGLHRVNSPVGMIHTASRTTRSKDEVAMIR